MLGTYTHQLDDKNRIRIPARLKAELKEEFTLTKGVDGCIYVFAQSVFASHINGKLDEVSIGDRAAQRPLRLLMASAYEVKEDKQGRLILPDKLIEHAGIKKNIIILGVGNRAEIWDEERWNAYCGGDDDFDTAMDALKNFKI
jgi:MraZ protein